MRSGGWGLGRPHTAALHTGVPLRTSPLAKMLLQARGPEHKHCLRPGVHTESVSDVPTAQQGASRVWNPQQATLGLADAPQNQGHSPEWPCVCSLLWPSCLRTGQCGLSHPATSPHLPEPSQESSRPALGSSCVCGREDWASVLSFSAPQGSTPPSLASGSCGTSHPCASLVSGT